MQNENIFSVPRQWLLCPLCNHKTRIQVIPQTKIRNLPVWCPKCGKESIIDMEQLNITNVIVPDA